ncbi:hypothetical protein [uncultured Croceitalea sp.]|uniref:hypothetical protein n=1 Tax=uncultured Croceitalea sp. TaxID=1798908 RepID=UPI003305A6FE
MRRVNVFIVLTTFLLGGIVANAQAEVKKLDFKKGEVLDILLFTGKPELGKLFPRYKETAFAFALETGYQPQPLLSVLETTQGGYQPGSLVFGKWKDLNSRKKFLNEITTKVPDFHQQRRAMWSTFYLAYYEMENDVTFEINPEKVIVATAYWKDNSTEFNSFKKEWLKKAQGSGGKVLLELTDARSSMGYMYKPDYVVLTEWNDRAAFNAFHKENIKMSDNGVQNVNEFVIQ